MYIDKIVKTQDHRKNDQGSKPAEYRIWKSAGVIVGITLWVDPTHVECREYGPKHLSDGSCVLALAASLQSSNINIYR